MHLQKHKWWLAAFGGILLALSVFLWLRPSPVMPQDVSDGLREQVRRNPRDGRGWALLAYAAVERNDFAEAAAAFEKAVAVSPKVATDPGVLCDWADALGMLQGGSLKGKPSELVSRALAIRANFPKALEMAGSAAYEAGQFPLAANYWSRLRVQMQEGTPGRLALDAGIARAEQLANQ